MGGGLIECFVPHEVEGVELMILENDWKGSLNKLESFMKIEDI